MLTVSEGRPIIIIMVGIVGADQRPGAVAASFTLGSRGARQKEGREKEERGGGERRVRREKKRLGLVWAFETSKPNPSDTPPLTRPHLLILPKQFHQLMTKHPNT